MPFRLAGAGVPRWCCYSDRFRAICGDNGIDVSKCANYFSRVGAPIGFLRKQCADQILKRAGMCRWTWGPGENGRYDCGQSWTAEWGNTLDGRVQGSAESPHVDGRPDSAAFKLLRGHVVGGSDQ